MWLAHTAPLRAEFRRCDAVLKHLSTRRRRRVESARRALRAASRTPSCVLRSGRAKRARRLVCCKRRLAPCSSPCGDEQVANLLVAIRVIAGEVVDLLGVRHADRAIHFRSGATPGIGVAVEYDQGHFWTHIT